MNIAIQQPEHLPWVGFFNKMAECDLFVYLDNVQYKKRYFENRNKIKTKSGPAWVTVPVFTKGRYLQNINEVEIDYEQAWQKKYKGQLEHAYSKCAYWQDIRDVVFAPLDQCHKTIDSLNLALIDNLRDYLEISTPVKFSSEEVSGNLHGSELILEICLKTKADVYISGPDGREYLDGSTFRHNKIEISYHDFTHPVYAQGGGQFLSHLSVVDMIANCGRKSASLIKSNCQNIFDATTKL